MDRKRERYFLMAHFAELDDKNMVTRVIVVYNGELLDHQSGNELEQKGIDFCVAHYGGDWVQTSYNGNFRFNYAGSGYTYDAVRDAFIAPKCHDEAVLDEATCRWTCENVELLTGISTPE